MLLSWLLSRFQSLPQLPQGSWPFCCWFPGGWTCICSRTLWVSPANSPVRLGSFYCCHNAHRFLQLEVLRLYFPALELWVVWSVLLPPVVPPGLSALNVGMPRPPWSSSHCLAAGPLCPAARLAPSYQSGWCFFFNSLVVRLPGSSIFWQFWLFFVLKFVVVLLLVVQGSTVYLPTPLPWPEVSHFLFILSNLLVAYLIFWIFLRTNLLIYKFYCIFLD